MTLVGPDGALSLHDTVCQKGEHPCLIMLRLRNIGLALAGYLALGIAGADRSQFLPGDKPPACRWHRLIADDHGARQGTERS